MKVSELNSQHFRRNKMKNITEYKTEKVESLLELVNYCPWR